MSASRIVFIVFGLVLGPTAIWWAFFLIGGLGSPDTMPPAELATAWLTAFGAVGLIMGGVAWVGLAMAFALQPVIAWVNRELSDKSDSDAV